jgi:hypothetical protein
MESTGGGILRKGKYSKYNNSEARLSTGATREADEQTDLN